MAAIPFLPPSAADVVIDLSHWQANVDFPALRQAGIIATILKATEGTGSVDPTFATRAAAAANAGLLVGAYHFLDSSDPVAQADHFLECAGRLRMLAVDLESVPPSCTAVANAAIAVNRILDSTGSLPTVYTGRYQIPTADQVLSQCPLWLAEYGSLPVCPPGWSQWKLWQYTDAGSIPGVSGAVDRSRFAGSIDELRGWWGTASDT